MSGEEMTLPMTPPFFVQITPIAPSPEIKKIIIPEILSQLSSLFFALKKEIPRSKKRRGMRKYPTPKSRADMS